MFAICVVIRQIWACHTGWWGPVHVRSYIWCTPTRSKWETPTEQARNKVGVWIYHAFGEMGWWAYFECGPCPLKISHRIYGRPSLVTILIEPVEGETEIGRDPVALRLCIYTRATPAKFGEVVAWIIITRSASLRFGILRKKWQICSTYLQQYLLVRNVYSGTLLWS